MSFFLPFFHLLSIILTTAVVIYTFAPAVFTQVHGDFPLQSSVFRILIRKKILVLFSINYCIWLSTSILKSGRFCTLRCVCRLGQFACAYRSAKWLSNGFATFTQFCVRLWNSPFRNFWWMFCVSLGMITKHISKYPSHDFCARWHYC